jgi:hypothetical protein
MKQLDAIFQKTNGFKSPDYLRIYEELFAPKKYEHLTLLELGIHEGGSLRAWAEYFPRAEIVGIDLQLPPISEHGRIHMYAADQADVTALSRAAAETAPDGFDIIIDDCSHIAKLAKVSFWHLFNNHLKPDGIYCIEDWATGYWGWWPDGRSVVTEPDAERRMPSHDAGMVGFLKQLMDEFHSAIREASQDELFAAVEEMASGKRDEPTREEVDEPKSKFASLTLYPGICVIRKSQ